MRPIPTDISFPALQSDIASLRSSIEATGTLPVAKADDSASCEALAWCVYHALKTDDYTQAQAILPTINHDFYAHTLLDAWLHIAEMDVAINDCDYPDAIVAAQQALRTLVDTDADKKSLDYLAIAVSVVYNLAYIHFKLGENARAEKELVKAQKLFENLAKKDKNRFGAALVHAIEASTTIFNSRLKQMNILAHYQVATELYLDKANHGTAQAILDLVNSLYEEGSLHLEMGNYHDAVKYFTKALRYQKKITSKFGEKELQISISLGKALINIRNRRDTGIQLLTSLMPVAEKLNATGELADIKALLDSTGKAFDFMAFFKKIF